LLGQRRGWVARLGMAVLVPDPSLIDLVAPESCALLLQEVQVGVIGVPNPLGLFEAAQEVGLVSHVAALAKSARKARVPVIHCTGHQMPDRFGINRNARLFAAADKSGTLTGEQTTSPLPEVFEAGDLVIPRYHGLSPLTGSPLDSLLRNEGITTLVVTGVSLNIAIPNLVFDAVNRAYQVVVVTDAVAGVPIAYGEQVIRYALRAVATLTTSDALTAVWDGRGTRALDHTTSRA
jgi:biuret amidohydrolase